MSDFNLKIASPDGVFFDGAAKKLLVRAKTGDVCILAYHADYVTPIDKGDAKITDSTGNERVAHCSGGFLFVKDNIVRLAAENFSWKD